MILRRYLLSLALALTSFGFAQAVHIICLLTNSLQVQ
jgi:hypothetical protein